MSEPSSDVRRMRLRYAGVCRDCAAPLAAGTEALYERSSRSVRCLGHEEPSPIAKETGPEPVEAPVDIGLPGASARREHERRHSGREKRVRSKHPKIGGLILAVTEDPQSTTAWATGARGEELLGARLNQLDQDVVRVLHDRRIPGTRANIDHLAVAPSGVWVVDAKRYKGKRPLLKIEGGILRPRTEKLMVGSRDQTKLVDGMLKQLGVVRGVLDEGIPVHGALCFVDADWPLIGGAFTTRDVQVLWPKRLISTLTDEGPLDRDAIAEVHRTLAARLPRA